jgi:hypothetical protein
MSISALLKKKIAAQKLSLAAAAKAIGISVPSVRSGVAGKGTPNARSIPKYAKFLGISLEQAQKLAGNRKGKGKAKGGGKRRGRPPGSGKGRRRGRPPGRPRGRRRGRPPGRPAGTGRRGRPPSPGPSRAFLALIARANAALRKAEKHLAKAMKAK